MNREAIITFLENYMKDVSPKDTESMKKILTESVDGDNFDWLSACLESAYEVLNDIQTARHQEIGLKFLNHGICAGILTCLCSDTHPEKLKEIFSIKMEMDHVPEA